MLRQRIRGGRTLAASVFRFSLPAPGSIPTATPLTFTWNFGDGVTANWRQSGAGLQRARNLRSYIDRD